MNGSAKDLWARYRAAASDAPAAPPAAALPLVYHFCDNQRDADTCAALVMAGKKRATATSLAELERSGDPVPVVGDHAIITDWAGTALAVIRTTEADICRFADVSAAFARREGEGDLTLGWWRGAHRAYYQRVLAGSGHAIDDDLMIACESFEIVLSGDAPIATEPAQR